MKGFSGFLKHSAGIMYLLQLRLLHGAVLATWAVNTTGECSIILDGHADLDIGPGGSSRHCCHVGLDCGPSVGSLAAVCMSRFKLGVESHRRQKQVDYEEAEQVRVCVLHHEDVIRRLIVSSSDSVTSFVLAGSVASVSCCTLYNAKKSFVQWGDSRR